MTVLTTSSGGRPDQCSRTIKSISHDGTYRQAVDVDRIDAAILAEELTEIYSTPTPKGWPKPQKVNNLYWIDCVSFTIAGV